MPCGKIRGVAMRKFVLLLVVLIFTASVPVFGNAYKIGETIGYVVEFDGEFLHIVGEPVRDLGLSDVIVRVGNVPIYDLLTGFPVDSDEIFEDVSIRMVYSLYEGEPLDALTIWLNWDFDDAAVFTVVVSGSIQYGEDFCIFLSADEKYRVTLTPDTVIIDPYYGRLSLADVEPGQEFFLWVDMITASAPALVYPDKAVLVR